MTSYIADSAATHYAERGAFSIYIIDGYTTLHFLGERRFYSFNENGDNGSIRNRE